MLIKKFKLILVIIDKCVINYKQNDILHATTIQLDFINGIITFFTVICSNRVFMIFHI